MSTEPKPRRGWPLRLAGGLVGLGLTALWFIVTVGLLLDSRLDGAWEHSWIVMALLYFIPLFWLAWKRVAVFGSWPRVAAGAAVLALATAWLAWDDREFEQRITLDDLSPPAGPDAAESHAVTLWYTEGAGRTRRPFQSGKLAVRASPAEKPDEWRAEITRAREEIVAEWEALAPEREWFAAMDAFPAIGDDATGGFDAPLMSFAPFRRVTMIGQARAGLLALEGRGDEAADILIRQLSVSAKLERNSRTLVRSMTAMVGLRNGIGAAEFVLRHATVSRAKRDELAAVLRDRDPRKVARRVVWADFINLRAAMLEQPGEVKGLLRSELGAVGSLLSVARPVVFLPRATANTIGRHLERIEAAASAGDLARVKALHTEWTAVLAEGGPKNFGGRFLISLAQPHLTPVVERNWQIEAERLALLEGLNPE